MKKSALEQRNLELERENERLARLLRSTQARALGVYGVLERALHPHAEEGEAWGSEQVAQIEGAIKEAQGLLARVVDPIALTQTQAEQTVRDLKARGLYLHDALLQYSERERAYGAQGLLAILKSLAEQLQLHLALDRCICVELGGERCLFCTTNEALEQGEAWIRRLEQPERSQRDEEARAWTILTRADQAFSLYTLVHENDRDMVPITADRERMTPSHYLSWLLIEAFRAIKQGVAHESSSEDCEGLFQEAALYLSYASDLLLLAIPAMPGYAPSPLSLAWQGRGETTARQQRPHVQKER